MTDSCEEIFCSSHHSGFTWKIALRTVFWVREFEPSLFEPGVYFNIKYIGKLAGPTNKFEQSLVFETGEIERPKFDCNFDQTFMKFGSQCSVHVPKTASEYDQEIPQSQTADNPAAPRGRAAQPPQDTRKTNQAKQSALSSPTRWLQY